MQVVEYLKKHGIQSLKDNYSILVKEYPEAGLLVLNYDQINSPRNVPIVDECRSLILDTEYNIVSRSFDRFYNYGECGATFDPVSSYAMEKLDGSLIKIYWYKGNWYIATRGTAFAESKVNGFDITFAEMVYQALGLSQDLVTAFLQFQLFCNLRSFIKGYTYICEITGRENRVVTQYTESKLYLLGIRRNNDGKMFPNTLYSHCKEINLPKVFRFSSVEKCVETAKSLPDLQEGYVIYSKDNLHPICKVKSPAYVAVHHIRGEGLNPKRIAELVCMNEQEEYLNYYPEDRKYFTPYKDNLNKSLMIADTLYASNFFIESQKEFALAVKDSPVADLLFQARKKKSTIYNVWKEQPLNYKVKTLLKLMGEKE